MKHIKTYEDLNNGPQPGDYVVFYYSDPGSISPKTGNIIQNTSHYVIGQIFKELPIWNNRIRFYVEYKLEGKKKYTRRTLDINDIIYYSKNKIEKSDLEMIINTNKYNI